jgi:hypothetical protein
MVLQARADITDKDGKKLSLSDQVYTHHILMTDMNRVTNMAPLMPSRSVCAARKDEMSENDAFEVLSKLNNFTPEFQHRSSLQTRSPQTGSGFGGIGAASGISKFSIFIAKGNEGDASVFAPLNTSSTVKSGYWIGKDDPVLGMAEVVNYKTVPQDVYLTLDYEYMPINAPRPAEYLDVGLGTVMVTQCGDLNLRRFINKLHVDEAAKTPPRPSNR